LYHSFPKSFEGKYFKEINFSLCHSREELAALIFFKKPLYFFFHSFLQKIIFGKKTEMRATNEQTLRFTKKSWTQKKGNDSFVPKKV